MAKALRERLRICVNLINFLLLIEEQSKTPINTTLTYEPNINIAPEGTTYCYVVRPDQPKTMPPHHSKCIFPELHEASDANGKWTVISGIDGRTDELNFDVNVASIQTFGNVFNSERFPFIKIEFVT